MGPPINRSGSIVALGYVWDVNTLTWIPAVPGGGGGGGTVDQGAAGTDPWLITGAVTGPLTDTQLRATAVPVSAVSLPLPTGAATEAKQDTGNTSLAAIDASLAGTLDVAVVGTVDVSGSTVDADIALQPLTPASPATATAATSSGEILAANPARTGLVLVNPNANRVSLGFGVAAVLDSGITLMPYGGSYTMTPGTFCRSAVYAIAADADTGIGLQEFT